MRRVGLFYAEKSELTCRFRNSADAEEASLISLNILIAEWL